MNKKGYFDLEDFLMTFVAIPFFILIGLLVIWGLVGVPTSMYKGYKFNKAMGSYCDLAYAASDIDNKIAIVYYKPWLLAYPSFC